MRKFETAQKEESRAQSADSSKAYIENLLEQWFPTGEEFPPREEFHEFRGGISTLQLSYLFSVQ